MKPLRVLHVNTFELAGGASRAAHRLHLALREQGVASEMLVMQRDTDASHVWQPHRPWRRAARRVLEAAGAYALALQRMPAGAPLRSLNLFPSGLAEWINRSDCDLVNLHWLGCEMLSVEEIGRIRKPVCWTLHDMWPFCGAEHYEDLQWPDRYRAPYGAGNRPPVLRGVDLDAWTWRRKARAWPRLQLELVAPSRWMAGCAGASALLQATPCTAIPNPLDTDVFRPQDRAAARHALGLDLGKRYILFGATTGTHDPRKGFHLLLDALGILARRPGFDGSTELLVFGARQGASLPPLPFPAHSLGYITADARLAQLYAAADVFAAPSLQDNLPNTVAEALACGTPTVGFATGGMADLVLHRATGWLAPPFSTPDFAEGLAFVLDQGGFGARCRAEALARLERGTVARQYIEVYRRLAQLATSGPRGTTGLQLSSLA